MTSEQVEEKIREFFEENYEMMRMETGQALAEAAKADALQQVIFYYQKLQEVAEKVTDTEVRLTLPDQKTPKGRPFSIEGIVDIVREDEEVRMYDIKTHDPDFVRQNRDLYEKQLNVYAHIWCQLRGNALDGTAIISTVFPKELKRAWDARDVAKFIRLQQEWNPLIELDYNAQNVGETILDFGRIVDAIEDHEFSAPGVVRLQEPYARTMRKFGTVVCRNCDGRFSCHSYRSFALGSRVNSAAHFRKYMADIAADEEAQEDFMTGALIAEEGRNTPIAD